MLKDRWLYLNSSYAGTITIVNTLNRADTVLETNDEYYKTVLTDCRFVSKTVRTVSGNTVSIGKTSVVLIPFGKGYLPYDEWKDDVTKGFTVSDHDTIFLGMELQEIPTRENITSLKNTYKNSICDVRIVNVAKQNGMVDIELKIEGV